ncbi:TrmH family RNA methyltransferase [Crateriforma conspicua]|uniref:TrmH family RNA methyltransferase n=1 Tax=Crateriforma conspicua TaxID=2527996 RepID=UPI001189DE3F|nr:RNA methyltransferase [Crateriforma conspicua]QDV64956.1 23S rRNA (guanosine-2'-O-)-methyltransferase RlmB [Crateriforma conspicua]
MTSSTRPILRSPANPTIRRLVRLRDNRRRRQFGRFLIDGWRETAAAVQSGLCPEAVYVSANPGSDSGKQADAAASDMVSATGEAAWSDWLPGDEFDLDARTVLKATPIIQPVSPAVMSRISYGQNARGAVAEFLQPDWSLSRLDLPASPLLLVLDSIEKPGNLGAVFRSADAAGVDAILITGESVDPFNANAIRSSLGTLFTVPAAVADRDQVAEFLNSRNILAYAARVEAAELLWECDLTGPVAVVLGSEAKGLGNHWRSCGGHPVRGIRIPMSGSADSLNLSISAAVIAFEAARRRQSE